MHNMRTAIIILLCLFFIPAHAQQKALNDVYVLPLNTQLPKDAQKIASIKIGNNSTRLHCNYDDLVIDAKQKALAAGGNVVAITTLVQPYFISKCYLIKADIYKVANTESYKKAVAAQQSSSRPADSTHTASVYIYRLADTTAFAPAYDLHINSDSVIINIKGKSHYKLQLPVGQNILWAESKDQSVTINMQQGHSYFLRCGQVMGEVRHIPYLELVPPADGFKEYQQLARQKKDIDISFLNQIH